MDIKKAAVVLNGFTHDFMSGYWLSTIITIAVLHEFQAQYPAVARILGEIERFFFWNSVAAVVIVLITGAGRAFTYVDNVFGETTEQTRRQLLIVKHIFLFMLFGGCGWWAYMMAFH